MIIPSSSAEQSRSKTLRVLHCLRAPVGGLFRHVCDLASAQSEAGYEVGVVCADEPNDATTLARLAELSSHCTLGLMRISLGRLPGISDFRAITACARLIHKTRPDVVHGHGAKGGLLARLVPAGHPVARIYTPHGGTIHYPPRSILGIVFGVAERTMLQWTDGLIFESAFAQTCFAERFGDLPSVTSVVHNGLTADEFADVALAPSASDFVFLGELRELKGIFTLIDAFEQLSSRSPASLAIVGDGPDAPALRAKVLELSLESKVRFLGAMPAHEAFAQGRMIVMPSHADSFPYVALEAAGAGRPLLATRTGGIPEIFGPYQDMLVAPRDANALATRMEAYLSDPALAAKAALQLQQRVKSEFCVNRMAASVGDVYAQAMQGALGIDQPDNQDIGTHANMDAAK